jgi:hypothetical protein
MNWIKVAARLEQGAIEMMDHARQIGRNSPPSRSDTIVAVAMGIAELARAFRVGETEDDRLIHSKEEGSEQNK